ncbi:unnamed protein product, partial [Rotaria magnacalcarata]
MASTSRKSDTIPVPSDDTLLTSALAELNLIDSLTCPLS